MDERRWIFGYGSLVWRPAFDFVERRPARLRGFARRFWQGSTDHRGTPEAPGRVVTLVTEPTSSIVGMAYRVDEALWSDVLVQLDHREKGGYVRHAVDLHTFDGEVLPGLVYLAGVGNADYLGPADPRTIAAQIRSASGPSGPNVEYLFELERWLREHGETEPHVFELAELVRALEQGMDPSDPRIGGGRES